MTLRKLIFRTLLTGFIFALILFGPIDTLDWPRAWVFLGILAAATTATYTLLFPTHKGLLLERQNARMQKGQPLADKIILLVYKLLMGSCLVFITLDVHRYHIFHPPGILVSGLGLLCFLAGWWWISWVFYTNPFAAPVVKYQAERQHHVVTTGPYAIVRHPMYAGLVPVFAGAALFLGSYAAAVLMILPLGALAIRIGVEERFLKEKLEGYEEYTRQVRYRVIPGIW
jgi:protein-S-isoprenylcysteine O-methyltransferase Ste14